MVEGAGYSVDSESNMADVSMIGATGQLPTCRATLNCRQSQISNSSDAAAVAALLASSFSIAVRDRSW